MSDDNYISQQELLDYLSGNLGSEAAKRISRIAEEDPFVADALDGLKMFKDPSTIESVLADLNRDISAAASKEKKEGKLIAFPTWAKGLAAAAIILVVFMFAYNSIIDSRTGEQIFTEKFEPYEELKEGEGIKEKGESGKVNGESEMNDQAVIAGDSDEQMDVLEVESEEEDVLIAEEKMILADDDLSIENVEEVAIAVDGSNEGNSDARFSAGASKELGKAPSASGDAKIKSDEDQMNDVEQFLGGNKKEELEIAEEPTVVISADEVRQVPTRSNDNIAATSSKVQTGEIQEITTQNKRKNRGRKKSKDRMEERSPLTLDAVKISTEEAQVVEIMMEARGYYLENNYRPALERYEEALKLDAGREEANFYAAVSILGLSGSDNSDVNKAISYLDKLVVNPQSKFFEAALWYRSLALLKVDRTKPAIKHLEKIIKMNGEYKDKASATLKELKD